VCACLSDTSECLYGRWVSAPVIPQHSHIAKGVASQEGPEEAVSEGAAAFQVAKDNGTCRRIFMRLSKGANLARVMCALNKTLCVKRAL
jgi:hypothetical protein